MKYTALRNDFVWGLGESIIHKWTTGNEYEIVLDDENQVLVSLESDSGVATPDLPYKFLDKRLLLEVFNIALNTNEEQEE